MRGRPAAGDLDALKQEDAKGANLACADYDGRTALHLAASEGHADVVAWIIEKGIQLEPRDRWNGTPLDDAGREGHTQIAQMLRVAGSTARGTDAAT